MTAKLDLVHHLVHQARFGDGLDAVQDPRGGPGQDLASRPRWPVRDPDRRLRVTLHVFCSYALCAQHLRPSLPGSSTLPAGPCVTPARPASLPRPCWVVLCWCICDDILTGPARTRSIWCMRWSCSRRCGTTSSMSRRRNVSHLSCVAHLSASSAASSRSRVSPPTLARFLPSRSGPRPFAVLMCVASSA